MKRIKAACIQQTLVFSQNEGSRISREYAEKLNRGEVDKYQKTLERSRTKYKIVEDTVQSDGSIIIKVMKQYNYKADVGEYFD